MPSASVIGIISVIATVASTAVSVVGQDRAADTQRDILKYQARVARDRATAEETQARRQASVELGRERAVLGKLGILPTKGSPLEQLAFNTGEAERRSVLAGRGLLEEAGLLDLQASSISSQQGLLKASGVLSGLASASTYASPLLTRSTTGTRTVI